MPASPKGPLTQSEESTLIARGYKLRQLLGEGSYAKVYLSFFKHDGVNTDKDANSQLACKVIDTAKSPHDYVKKFLPREMDILIRINHPHIIHIHSIFQRKAKYFVFMRYAELGDVLEFVMKNGALTEHQARVWFKQIALAIQYLHELEIAHRDLKCENVLITANFNVKIADFGFAREVVDIQARRVLSETYCGSLSYTAPEILKSIPYLPKNVDVWSSGVILYILLNRAMPFDDSNIKKLIQMQVNRQWNFRSRVAKDLSVEVRSLVSHMLEPDPQKRYNINQVLTSDWFNKDPNMTALTVFEADALVDAIDQKRKRFGNVDAHKHYDRKRSVQVTGGITEFRQLKAAAVVHGLKSAPNKNPPKQGNDKDEKHDIPADHKLVRK